MNDVVVRKSNDLDVGDISERKSAELLVRARCRVSVGDECTVYFPDHCDADSYDQHRNYHNQSAVVVSIGESSVDLRMTTGRKTGSVVHNVAPMHIFFCGLFVKESE